MVDFALLNRGQTFLDDMAEQMAGGKLPNLRSLQDGSKLVGTVGTVGTGGEEPSIHEDFGIVAPFPHDKKAVGTGGNKQGKAQKTEKSDPPFFVSEGQKGRRNGVYWRQPDDPDEAIWLCSPLHVIAETRDVNQSDWGRLLEWKDADGHVHTWACPAEMLTVSDASEFRRELARNGLVVSSSQKSRQKIVDYVLNHVPATDVRMRCVNRVGWHGDNYVTPGRVFGHQGGEGVVYQGGNAGDFNEAGTLDDWKRDVSTVAAGNTRIVFAISAAFAGTLSEMAGESGGGFHFVGTTSKGKTSTLLDPASSVWGNPESFAKKWRTTTNGLEALCTGRNDGVLILDELAQVAASEAGGAAYLIANGQAKARMTKEGGNRPTSTWRTMLLSAGEIDLAQHMAEAGKSARGGQMARLPSVSADAGAGMGTLEALHQYPDGKSFADAMKANTRRFYGVAGTAFIEQLSAPNTLAEIRESIRADIAEAVTSFNIPKESSEEVGRVASRFGLVAFAGEMATGFGVTGWNPGEALTAARRCFRDWLADNGGGISADERTLIEQVTTFMQAHHASRFPSCDATPEELARFHSIVGYRFDDGADIEFWALPGPMKKEMLKGFSSTWAMRTLIKRGMAKQGDFDQGKQRTTVKRRVKAAGSKPINVHVIMSAVLSDNES